MSKRGPKLSVKTGKEITSSQADAIYNEIYGYSITPNTFTERAFVEDATFPFFIDKYESKKSLVERYGLNIHSQALREEVKEYNKVKKDYLELKSLASSASGSGKKDQSDPKKTILDHRETSKKILTKLEYYNTNKAIDHLAKSNEITVLVDIFDRDADNNIKMKGELPEIHTVVLYKKFIPSQKSPLFLVIDPNNATFSSILAGADENVRICFTQKLQIYKPKGNRGPEQDNWRDCIDVAVKLAFNLALNLKLGFDDVMVSDLGDNVGSIDFTSLRDSPSIREITNEKPLYQKLHVIVKDSPVRAKQSSDVLISKKTTALLTITEVITSKLSKAQDDLKEKNMLCLANRLEQQEESLVKQLSHLQDPSEYFKNIGKIFSSTLEKPFYDIIESEVHLLALEFQYIDQCV